MSVSDEIFRNEQFLIRIKGHGLGFGLRTLLEGSSPRQAEI